MTKYLRCFLLLAFTASAMGATSPQVIPNDQVQIGKSSAADKTIILNKGSGSSNPKIKWNNSSSKLQYSNDGTTFKTFGLGTDIDSAAATNGQVLTANGSGGSAFTNPASSPRSEIFVTTATGTGGVGTTDTAIRRFLTVVTSTGSAVTRATSAANGDTYTINTTGVYAITHTFQFTGSTVGGISVNSSQLTTSIDSITAADRLISSFSIGANATGTVSVTLNLTAGDVIRPHITVGGGIGTTTVGDTFRIVQVAN